MQVEKLLAEGCNNEPLPNGIFGRCLKSAFDSSKTYGLFTACFDAELYHYATQCYNNSGSLLYVYSVLGVARVLEDVESSQRNHSLYQDMNRFLEEDFALVRDDTSFYQGIIYRLRRYITALVLVRMYQNTNMDALELLSVSDNRAKISQSSWHQDVGVTYEIESYAGNLEVVAKATVDGQVRIYLWALMVIDQQTKKHIPYWIDYTRLVVNGKVIFDKITPVWHDKNYRYIMNVKAGEEVKVQVEWLPHRSDT